MNARSLRVLGNFWNMKRRLSIISALFICLFVYTFYRSEKTVVNELIISVLGFVRYVSIKSIVTSALPLSETIIYSLPGGLWMFCVTALSMGFYMNVGRHRIQMTLVPILFAIGLEFCQLFQITNGRFDLWDIAFYLLFWLLAFLTFRSEREQANIMAPFTFRGFMCLACFLSVYLAHVSQ